MTDRTFIQTNPLTPAEFAEQCEGALLALAAFAGDRPLGLLLAFGPATLLRGPNHGWMRAHHPRAAYVDRVVVAAEAQGQGLGRVLYAALAGRLAAAGLDAIGCEVNLDPPNPESLAFHRRLGFAPVGEATDPRNGKRVQYLLAADLLGKAADPAAHFLRSAR